MKTKIRMKLPERWATSRKLMVFKISSTKNSLSVMSVAMVAIPSEQMITKTRRVMLFHVQDREAKL